MSNWGAILEHGKETSEGSGVYIYPYHHVDHTEIGKCEKGCHELPNSKNYRVVLPNGWPSYDVTEDNKGNIFEIIGNLKHPYVEFCDKDDRPEAMGV